MPRSRRSRAATRPPDVASEGSWRHSVIPDHVAQTGPLVVVHDGDRHPGLTPGAVDPVRRRLRMCVAVASEQRPGGAVLDELLGGHVQGRLDQGDLDELTEAGPVAVADGRQHGERPVQGADGIARAARDQGRPVGKAGDRGQAGRLLHGLGEPGPVPPRSGQAPGRHPQRDEIGTVLVEQAEALDHAGRVVLDQDVAVRQQPAAQLLAAWISQIEGHGAACPCSPPGTAGPAPIAWSPRMP